MLLLLNILALAAMVAIAYMSATQGIWSAAKTVVACVVAGVVAFGFAGPLAGLFPSDRPDGLWYYAADAFGLWALFCVVFLGVRTLSETFLKAQPEFPALANRIGGAALGAATGYLAVGVCLVVVQMLPVAPKLLGAYEPFRYEEGTNAVRAGDRLWLAWDRGAIAFFGYLLEDSLGPGQGSLFGRYGDLYRPREPAVPTPSAVKRLGPPAEGEQADLAAEAAPPAEAARAAGQVNADVDDVLYYHWYRRWEYVKWRTGKAQGPLPREKAEEKAPGLVLSERNKWITMEGVKFRFTRVGDEDKLEGFEAVRPGDAKFFLLLDVQLTGEGEFPRKVDSSQFVLFTPDDRRIGDPLIHSRAKRVRGEEVVDHRKKSKAESKPRNLRFNIPEGRTRGHCLMDGETITFTAENQTESRALVFVVSEQVSMKELRLVLEPTPVEAETPKP